MSELQKQRKDKRRMLSCDKIIAAHTVEAQRLRQRLEKPLAGNSRVILEWRLNLLLNHPEFPALIDH